MYEKKREKRQNSFAAFTMSNCNTVKFVNISVI